MMELSERIIEVLEAHDISLCGEISERKYHNDGYDVELETYSPEGENVIISLIYDGTEEDFINQFESYAEDFDSEEHAEMWIEARGSVSGVPNSIRDLINDANWIKNMLLMVSKELSESITGNLLPINNEIFEYLENFMIQNNWLDEYTPKQARAIFTTICLVGNIDIDTAACDNMLLELYNKADIETIDISYDDFESYMVELIV